MYSTSWSSLRIGVVIACVLFALGENILGNVFSRWWNSVFEESPSLSRPLADKSVTLGSETAGTVYNALAPLMPRCFAYADERENLLPPHAQHCVYCLFRKFIECLSSPPPAKVDAKTLSLMALLF